MIYKALDKSDKMGGGVIFFFTYIQNGAFWGIFKVVYKCMKKKFS
jgi:hypothetical protein